MRSTERKTAEGDHPMGNKVMEICAKLNIGGAQLVAANISKYAPDGLAITYLVFGDEIGEYEPEILARGHRVVHMRSPRGNSLGYMRSLISLMRSEGFDAVHCHTMFSSGTAMLAAWLAGVPGRISHSHTAKDDAGHSLPRRLYRRMMRGLMRLFGTDYLACGEDAGSELYGKNWFRRHGRVIKNGIDTALFRYDPAVRQSVRARYGVEDSFVIGHVGHYVPVKNQSFLISLMPEILRIRPDAVLLMFGEGEDREKLRAAIDAAQLGNAARLMGNVRDVYRVLSGLDVFAFPSLFEGTPLALIEAQANGLPCVISDRIPKDACLTDLISAIPLEKPEEWLQKICAATREPETNWSELLRQSYGTVENSMESLYRLFGQYHNRKRREAL